MVCLTATAPWDARRPVLVPPRMSKGFPQSDSRHTSSLMPEWGRCQVRHNLTSPATSLGPSSSSPSSAAGAGLAAAAAGAPELAPEAGLKLKPPLVAAAEDPTAAELAGAPKLNLAPPRPPKRDGALEGWEEAAPKAEPGCEAPEAAPKIEPGLRAPKLKLAVEGWEAAAPKMEAGFEPPKLKEALGGWEAAAPKREDELGPPNWAGALAGCGGADVEGWEEAAGAELEGRPEAAPVGYRSSASQGWTGRRMSRG